MSEAGVIRGPEQLLGRSIDQPEVRQYLAAYGSFPDPDQSEDRVYWSFYGAGVALLTNPSSVIQTVFLYNAGHEGYSEYAGPLPLGLRLDLTHNAIRQLLGEPAFVSPAKQIEYLGRKGPMERYDLRLFSIHAEYSEATDRLLVLTLMTPNAIPGADEVH